MYLVELTVLLMDITLTLQPSVERGALVTGGGYTLAPIPIHRPTAKPSNRPIYTP